MKPDDSNFTQVSQLDSDDNFTQDSLLDRATRLTYFVTYSKIDKYRFPTKERFTIFNPLNEAEGKSVC